MTTCSIFPKADQKILYQSNHNEDENDGSILAQQIVHLEKRYKKCIQSTSPS